MANRTPRAGKLQPKTVARLCNQLLEDSGMIFVIGNWMQPTPRRWTNASPLSFKMGVIGNQCRAFTLFTKI